MYYSECLLCFPVNAFKVKTFGPLKMKNSPLNLPLASLNFFNPFTANLLYNLNRKV